GRIGQALQKRRAIIRNGTQTWLFASCVTIEERNPVECVGRVDIQRCIECGVVRFRVIDIRVGQRERVAIRRSITVEPELWLWVVGVGQRLRNVQSDETIFEYFNIPARWWKCTD